MPFSHHSHSGQFCPGHAKDGLEEVVLEAISKRMQVFALTEHMPRHEVDFYPEEMEAGMTLAFHFENEAAYFSEACRLRCKYRSQIGLPIGFECDWIRPESQGLIERSIETYPYDFFVGSVHHVHTVPIDYDRDMYEKAREKAGGTDERLFEDYFDAQLAMLKATKPPVVGHLDLIRLKSDQPDGSFRNMEGVWSRILRNLSYIASYGGVIELNFAALRKGMIDPYPNREICQVWESSPPASVENSPTHVHLGSCEEKHPILPV
jgi:histidinol-phosphatase (PHP family)